MSTMMHAPAIISASNTACMMGSPMRTSARYMTVVVKFSASAVFVPAAAAGKVSIANWTTRLTMHRMVWTSATSRQMSAMRMMRFTRGGFLRRASFKRTPRRMPETVIMTTDVIGVMNDSSNASSGMILAWANITRPEKSPVRKPPLSPKSSAPKATSGRSMTR